MLIINDYFPQLNKNYILTCNFFNYLILRILFAVLIQRYTPFVFPSFY